MNEDAREIAQNTVTLEVENGVALVLLNRPEVKNALSRAMRRRLIAVFDEISSREDIHCAVLSGAGTAFCAGADLRDRPNPDLPGDFLDHNRWTRETGNAIKECAKPVIAAVNGAALGAGLGLMASCDIMYASENAVFAMPEINVGLAGGASMLRTLFGRSTVRRMFFTGDRLTAHDLLRRNVLEDVLPPEQLMPHVMELARRIASKSPIAIVQAKKAANFVDQMPQREAYRHEQDITMMLARTEDAKEARAAFLEKRVPVFKGR
ncbi:enoyl-CoA hydratase/isomerase family protein [Paraburkholderia tropica]|uniref:Short chain enoyl-CoA hydratase n=1 Tax=Paraburkholderia tropica TaxID=92647 RepID=A0AAQ1JUC7_9BURK|nr:enoyl-CoA hydratase/isomerase family protein [Paraburkholderia tropica]PXX16860.1 short chain enoyl-CoA hydratase [Paraburkholderia tropica]PZW83997.1 short chain enoyl-CoA hydratase [Paraburkholderia tropica]SEJ70593.1 short chain enoyl-CoA hydratase [Paraburkholderia tropica]